MTFLRGFVKMAGGRTAGGWEWECYCVYHVFVTIGIMPMLPMVTLARNRRMSVRKSL